MGFLDDGVDKTRGMMKQVVENTAGDDIPSYERPQGKLGP